MYRTHIVVVGFLLLPVISHAKCDPVPYSVQAKDYAGKVVIKLPPKFADPSNVPKPASITLGVEYVRSMYAAMGPTVVEEVLENYACRFNEVVDNDENRSAEDKASVKAAFRDAVDELTKASSIYFPTFAAREFVQAQAIATSLKSAPPLLKESRVPMSYLNDSIGKIADDSFLITNSYDAYIQASLNGVEVTACGKYLRAALAENAGVVQHLAASLKTTLFTYFSDSKQGVKSAMTKIFAQAASAASVSEPTRPENVTLIRSCST